MNIKLELTVEEVMSKIALESNDSCNVAWTPEVIAAYEAQQAANRP